MLCLLVRIARVLVLYVVMISYYCLSVVLCCVLISAAWCYTSTCRVLLLLLTVMYLYCIACFYSYVLLLYSYCLCVSMIDC